MIKLKSIFLTLILLFAFLNANSWNIFVKGTNGYEMKYQRLDNISINGVAEKFGFKTNFFYTYMKYEDEKRQDIFCVLFKVFSSDAICVITEDNVMELYQRDVDIFLKEYNFDKVFDTYKIESCLNQGIEDRNFTLPFISDVMNINCDTTMQNGMIVSNRLKYNLYFLDGILIKYETSDGYTKWAKDMQKNNPIYFNKMVNYAAEYWKDDKKSIIKEVNAQCDAWASCESGFSNEHLYKFLSGGVYNFKMLNVLYGNDTINLREFKDLNHGNVTFYKKTTTKDKGKDTKAYIYYTSNGIFAFDELGNNIYCKPY